MRHSLPATAGTRGCVLVPIDVDLLPVVAGALAPLEEARLWIEGDYQRAYQSIAELEALLTLLCAQELIESNNRLYRLLDWSLNGVVYDAGINPPDTITPAIPAVPSQDTAEPGLVRELFRTRLLLDNALNGDINQDYAIQPSIRDQLQSIIDGLTTEDTDIEGIIQQLEAIALLLG